MQKKITDKQLVDKIVFNDKATRNNCMIERIYRSMVIKVLKDYNEVIETCKKK